MTALVSTVSGSPGVSRAKTIVVTYKFKMARGDVRQCGSFGLVCTVMHELHVAVRATGILGNQQVAGSDHPWVYWSSVSWLLHLQIC